MQNYYYVALVSLLTALVYFGMAACVSLTHRKVGIFASTMTGDPLLERTVRAHANTLEWMPIVLPSLRLFAIYWDATVAAILGVVWIVGRIIYFVGYIADANKRRLGFFFQIFAVFALMLGALGQIIYLVATNTAP